MIWLDIFFRHFVGFGWGYGQDFLGEGVVVIFGQIVLEDVGIGAGKLLGGFEAAGKG